MEEEEEWRGGAGGGGWSPGQPRRGRPNPRRRPPLSRPGSGRTCSWGWARARAAGARAQGAQSAALRTPHRPPRHSRGAGGTHRPAWVARAAGGAASRSASKCWTASSPPPSPTCAAPRRSLSSPAAPAEPSRGPPCAAGSVSICSRRERGRPRPPEQREGRLLADAPRTRLPLRPPPHPLCPPRPSRPRGGDRARDEGARRRGPEAHLCHQKSSSLPGTACLEQLLEPPPPPAEPAQSPVQPRTPEKGEELGSSQVSGPCARREPRCAGHAPGLGLSLPRDRPGSGGATK